MTSLDDYHRRTAERARSSIRDGRHDPATFRSTLLGVPAGARDAWLDLVLGFDEVHDDGPDLPPGGVPYLPCPVDVLLRVVDEAQVRSSDVFVDVGSGPGRAATLVHLLTGAGAIGLEVQPHLVAAARDIASQLRLTRVPSVEGDAAILTAFMTVGSVFFLNDPFSGVRLAKVLDDLQSLARTRPLRICCVNLPLPPRSWLTLESNSSDDLTIYRTTPHARALTS
jgi:SAM-dependent methyltransferase